MDFTGCGNTLDMQHPQVLQARHRQPALLGRRDARRRLPLRPRDRAGPRADDGLIELRGASSTSCTRTRCSRSVKLIAEPWDLGEGGYQVGNFPPGWTEWNGRFRDTVRRFWRGDAVMLPELAYRLTGSSDDFYGAQGRRPHASINFVTAHDGFTLARSRELREEAQRGQRRGQPRRRDRRTTSWNCGVEGPTTTRRFARVVSSSGATSLFTLFVSVGVPMISRRRRSRPHAGRQQQRLLPGLAVSWTPGTSTADDGAPRVRCAPASLPPVAAGAQRRTFLAAAAAAPPTCSGCAPDGERRRDRSDWAAPIGA